MKKRHIFFAVSLVVTFAIGYSDYLTGAHISMLLLYAVPILVAAWFCGTKEGLVVAAIAAICWFTVDLTSLHPETNEAIISWNAFSRLGIFALLAYAVSLQVALKRALKQEQLSARTDKLTGLLNREGFREEVEDEIARARRYRHPLSLAFIDLDDFKHVNDTFGHARGDRLLLDVSQTIMRTIRKTDYAGRVGGDEFTICFPETGPDNIRATIGKLLQAMEILTSQTGWQVTASVGVVTYVTICDTYDTMLGNADKLMYAAKEKGKNGAEYLVIAE